MISLDQIHLLKAVDQASTSNITSFFTTNIHFQRFLLRLFVKNILIHEIEPQLNRNDILNMYNELSDNKIDIKYENNKNLSLELYNPPYTPNINDDSSSFKNISSDVLHLISKFTKNKNLIFVNKLFYLNYKKFASTTRIKAKCYTLNS